MGNIHNWQVEESVEDARKIYEESKRTDTIAIMATMIYCARVIAASAPRDNFVSYIGDAAANLGDIRDSIDELSKIIKDKDNG